MLTERRPCWVEVGPELLKLVKLTIDNDIEMFPITFKQGSWSEEGQERGYPDISTDIGRHF